MIQSVQGANAMTVSSHHGVTPLPMRQLTQALRNDDLEGARKAWVEVVRNAPDGATMPKDGAFAEVGRALLAGDMAEAKHVATEFLRERIHGVRPPGQPVTPPVTDRGPTPAAAGGMAGGTIDLIA